ncbi:hypothetical protein [Umezawaea beigongshangensis]|uniref:hypothetical protein n=1 Tax=Umezawaea beigongshangensis TaxID=2780383 RepID=UPI0018F17BA2|nr:hypothetical protein [Umezawaea beigongshangensis]
MRRRLPDALVIVLALLLTSCSSADPTATDVRMSVQVDGARLGPDAPAFVPREDSAVFVSVRNGGSEAVHASALRLTGDVLGVGVFTHETRLAVSAEPGEQVSRSFSADLDVLGAHATGLVDAEFQLVGVDGRVLAAEEGLVELRGSPLSPHALAGLAVLVLTVLSWLATALTRLRAGPRRRSWREAADFLPAGVATGLLVVITLPVLGLLVPAPPAPLFLGTVLASTALGLTTRPRTTSPT